MKALKSFPSLAGQCCDIVLTKRDDGSVFVTFRSKPGYGYPALERSQIEMILQEVKELEEST